MHRIASSFTGVLHAKSFLVNNFADFPDIVRGKKKNVQLWWRSELATSIQICSTLNRQVALYIGKSKLNIAGMPLISLVITSNFYNSWAFKINNYLEWWNTNKIVQWFSVNLHYIFLTQLKGDYFFFLCIDLLIERNGFWSLIYCNCNI